MRQGVSGRRPRGRSGGGSGNSNSNSGGGRKNVPLKTQNFDSNGPDVRVRGNATQVYEKYLSLARDASVAGDRVIAESYFQHAEHYYRIANENTDPQTGPSRSEQQRGDGQQRGGQRGDGQQRGGEDDQQDADNGRRQQGERDGNRRHRSAQDEEDRPGRNDSDLDGDERGTRQERRERYEQSERGDVDGNVKEPSQNGEAHDMGAGDFDQPRELHQRPDGYGRLSNETSERGEDSGEAQPQEAPRKAPRRAAATRTRRSESGTVEGEAPKAPARRRKPAVKKPQDDDEGSGGSTDTSGGQFDL